jgi:hypothetical protein
MANQADNTTNTTTTNQTATILSIVPVFGKGYSLVNVGQHRFPTTNPDLYKVGQSITFDPTLVNGYPVNPLEFNGTSIQAVQKAALSSMGFALLQANASKETNTMFLKMQEIAGTLSKKDVSKLLDVAE